MQSNRIHHSEIGQIPTKYSKTIDGFCEKWYGFEQNPSKTSQALRSITLETERLPTEMDTSSKEVLASCAVLHSMRGLGGREIGGPIHAQCNTLCTGRGKMANNRRISSREIF